MIVQIIRCKEVASPYLCYIQVVKNITGELLYSYSTTSLLGVSSLWTQSC